MSMQPYQHNQLELKKQQVRKDARTALIATGVTVVALPIGLWASSVFVLIAIISGIMALYSGNKVRKAIAKDPNSPS